MNKIIIALSFLVIIPAAAQDKTQYTNLFCTSPDLRGDLYTMYEEELTLFPDELAARLSSGDCAWKDYDSDTTLTVLYPFNAELTMVSAVFDGVTLYAVTFNKYLDDKTVI